MTKLNEIEARNIAGHWFFLWADCMRVRSDLNAMYVRGAPSAKAFRPKDDPDPMCFVFLQVEHCLGPRDGVDWKLAKHLWVDRRSVDSFDHPNLSATGKTRLYIRKSKLVVRLATQIIETAPQVITPDSVGEAKRRIELEKRADMVSALRRRRPADTKFQNHESV